MSYALNNLEDAFQELDDSKVDTLQKIADLREHIDNARKQPNIDPVL